MKIKEVIDRIKAYHKGGDCIQEETTRDKILYGNAEIECTGIVTTCWATIDVIRQAKERNANLIICHEALFWNHGDHVDWLEQQNNRTFQEKKKLLEETGIVVWRDHDYIHSGIPMEDGTYKDGIFYGFMKMLGWESYLATTDEAPLLFQLPNLTVREIASNMLDQFHLNGMKIIGNLDANIKNVYICAHVLGHGDNDLITKVDQENIDLLITLELIDYTVSEYIRDSCMAGYDKAIIALGHFNAEERGMEYMTTYIHDAIKENIPCSYIQSGDMYEYITK